MGIRHHLLAEATRNLSFLDVHLFCHESRQPCEEPKVEMNGLTDEKNHFLLVPLMVQGHMIPMVDMACLIAERGALVSFVTTPVNAARIRPIIDRVKKAGLPVKFLELEFPCAESGLPDGCENVDLIPSSDLFLPFFEALGLLLQPLQLYLKEMNHAPTCIISDTVQWWTMNIARELNIPRLIFHGPSCFFSLCTHNIRQYKVYKNVADDFETVLIPNLPHMITVSKAQAPGGWFEAPGFEDIRGKAMRSEETADGVVINTYEELESEYIKLYEKTIGKSVWPIGPLSLYNKDVTSKATRGNKTSINEHQILNWLNCMGRRSVVFVNFGSIAQSGPSQIIEIGCGLEASNQPFIWVIKESEECPEVDNWMSSGFKERTRERSLVITGWAPQVVILSHPSVGGFMTHCGWNSTLEAIAAGLPMITCPHFADQFLNEKLVVEVLKIGIALGVKKPIPVEERAEVRVKRDQVEKAIVGLMEGGKEAEERRQKAREFGEMAQKAMEEGGSSYENLTRLIQFVTESAKSSA